MNLSDKPVYPIRSETFSRGITLRQHYAGLAMAAMADSYPSHVTAEQAVIYADALIKALTRSTND